MAKTNIDVSNGWPISDCVFCEDRTDDLGEDGPVFCITPAPYWKDAECLHDCFDKVVGLPAGFSNSMESIWAYYGKGNPRALLEAAGAKFSPEMDKYINS